MSFIDQIIEYTPAALPGVAAGLLSLYNWWKMRAGAKLNVEQFVTYGLHNKLSRDKTPEQKILYIPIIVNNNGSKPGMINDIILTFQSQDGEKKLNLDRRVEITNPQAISRNDFTSIIPQFPVTIPSQEGRVFLVECTDIYHDVIPIDKEVTGKITVKYGKNKKSSTKFPFKISSIDLKLAVDVTWVQSNKEAIDPSSDIFLLKKLLTKVGLEHRFEYALNDAYFDPSIKFNGTKIAKLQLARYDIRNLPDIIGSFTELRELNLTACKIEKLPDSIGNLKKLKTLKLADNLLTEIPDSISNLTNLEFLNLKRNDIAKLPFNIGNMVKLEELYLTENQLTSLPNSIGKMNNLRILFADSNSISALPKEITSLSSLETLWVSKCNLSSIPSDLENLSNLRILSIDENSNISSLPNSIGSLKRLEGLDIRKTSINDLPKSFFSIRNDFQLSYEHEKFEGEIGERIKTWGADLESKDFKIRISSMSISRKEV